MKFFEHTGKKAIGSRLRLLSDVITSDASAIYKLYDIDMSYDEIASVTGLSQGNVSVRLVRIRKELEAFVKRQQE